MYMYISCVISASQVRLPGSASLRRDALSRTANAEGLFVRPNLSPKIVPTKIC